jgi:hypothetical protein
MKCSLIFTLGAVALLTACSDGNGLTEDRSNNNNGNGGAGGDTGITAENAMTVAKITYDSALSAGIAAEFSGATNPIAASPVGPVLKIDGSFATAMAPSAETGNVPIPPTVEPCLDGGTSTTSGEIADPFTPAFTPGDFFDIVFENCNDGFSTINGSLYYVVDEFTGDLLFGEYDLTMTATFTDFQIQTSTDTLVNNGDVTVQLNSLQYPTISAGTSGDSLTVDGNNFSHTLTNFSGIYSQNVEAVPSPFSQGSSGTIDSTLLPGIVDYSSPVIFTGFDGEYPSEGEFLVVGANSSVRLVAVDNVNIEIRVDTDGDGVVDETIQTTWAALEGS